MQFFSASDVERLLPMAAAIEVIEAAMIAVSAGKAVIPLRQRIELGQGNLFYAMPGALRDPACFGAKLISVFPGNHDAGLASHLGAILLFEPERGQPVALVDGGKVTAIRTAAASGAATRALAREDARTLAIIGTGEQAYHHLEAMMAVRRISVLRIAGRNEAAAGRLAAHAREKYPALTVSAGSIVEGAARGADIICTVTAAPSPILFGDWVDVGAHLNVVGAAVAARQEIDEELVVKASVFVDYRPSAMVEAGEIIAAIKAGRITEDHIVGEIGETFAGAPGRMERSEITLYRSLGIVAQDLAAASYILEQGRKLRPGAEK